MNVMSADGRHTILSRESLEVEATSIEPEFCTIDWLERSRFAIHAYCEQPVMTRR